MKTHRAVRGVAAAKQFMSTAPPRANLSLNFRRPHFESFTKHMHFSFIPLFAILLLRFSAYLGSDCAIGYPSSACHDQVEAFTDWRMKYQLLVCVSSTLMLGTLYP